MQAPSFEGKLLNGNRIRLHSQLTPGRALLISFWATWCSPCLEELRLITETLRTTSDLPLDFLTINVDASETSSDILPTLKLYHFSFPVILDPKQEIFSKYNRNKALPFSVLIDPDGKILETYNGFHADMMANLRQKLLLSPRVAKEYFLKTACGGREYETPSS